MDVGMLGRSVRENTRNNAQQQTLPVGSPPVATAGMCNELIVKWM